MIRIDSIWLATEPMDMRAGTETALACDRDVRCGAVDVAGQHHGQEDQPRPNGYREADSRDRTNQAFEVCQAQRADESPHSCASNRQQVQRYSVKTSQAKANDVR